MERTGSRVLMGLGAGILCHILAIELVNVVTWLGRLYTALWWTLITSIPIGTVLGALSGPVIAVRRLRPRHAALLELLVLWIAAVLFLLVLALIFPRLVVAAPGQREGYMFQDWLRAAMYLGVAPAFLAICGGLGAAATAWLLNRAERRPSVLPSA